MASAHLRLTVLFVMLAALEGCKNQHGRHDQTGQHLTSATDNRCFSDLPSQNAAAAATAAYEHGDNRILIFEENGEGNYPIAPVSPEYRLDTARPWKPGSARVVSMPRTNTHEVLIDSDFPPTACGLRKQEWLKSYNSEICRRASAQHLHHCGVKYIQL